MCRKFIIYKSKKRAVIITAFSIALAPAGFLILEYGGDEVMGRGFIILSMLCLLFGVGSLYDRKPCIVLTERGITEKTTVRGEIEWDAILYVDDLFFRGRNFVRLLTAVDYKPELLRPGWFDRFDRMYGKNGLKAVYISTSYIEVDSFRLARFIGRMRAANSDERKKLLTVPPREW